MGAPRKPATRKVRADPNQVQGIAVQPHLEGLARSDKLPTAPRLSEAALQAQTRQTLAGLGYQSMEAGAARKKMECHCERCGNVWEQYPTGYQGNSLGFPDLSIYRNNLFPPVFMQVEMKGAGTAIRPAQQTLADLGRSTICYSIGEAVEAVLASEIKMDLYRLPDDRRERLEAFLSDNRHAIGRR